MMQELRFFVDDFITRGEKFLRIVIEKFRSIARTYTCSEVGYKSGYWFVEICFWLNYVCKVPTEQNSYKSVMSDEYKMGTFSASSSGVP